MALVKKAQLILQECRVPAARHNRGLTYHNGTACDDVESQSQFSVHWRRDKGAAAGLMWPSKLPNKPSISAQLFVIAGYRWPVAAC